MKLSLRARLILSFLGVIATTAALVVILANRITTDRFTYLVSNAGQMHARNLAPLFADYFAQEGSWNGVETLMDSYSALSVPSMGHGRRGAMMGMVASGGERLLLADAGGQIVADSQGQGMGIALPAADLGKGAPIVVGEQQVGTLIVASGLGTLTADQSAFLSQVKWLMVAAAVVAGLAVLLVGSIQVRRIVAPVRALADAARRVAGGEFAQIPVTSQDELGEMALAFNTMAVELQRQHALRRRAMANIAHELRTPLSVLQIDLESIEDGLTKPTNEVITRLQKEVVLLNRLVEDLRMLSLAEAGELHLEVQAVDVGTLVQTAAERVRGVAQEKGVGLTSRIGEGMPPVAGDAQRLSQVLFNLVSNALRHTPAGGRIIVAAQQDENNRVRVTVQDSGEGIAANELPHIFERFYRTDHARSRDTGGSGLGLAIARSLVEAHGGRIWVESVEGEGSTFAFELPLPIEPQSA
ncbi:MAG: HAMP domain-containing protein [Anaerolineae bacterium]|nr:HAMP domain-containing protein [Anaerolineae bacterium]